MGEKKTRTQQLAEPRAEYGAITTDLKQPIILEQDGHPAAVILPFDRYVRLRELETSEEERRRAAWTQLSALIENVHKRPSTYTSEQIEAEITAARVEVKEIRHARRSRR
jgi:PHD/YefM family antitoxin component YafN of YafNO toxin-antitoxin module